MVTLDTLGYPLMPQEKNQKQSKTNEQILKQLANTHQDIGNPGFFVEKVYIYIYVHPFVFCTMIPTLNISCVTSRLLGPRGQENKNWKEFRLFHPINFRNVLGDMIVPRSWFLNGLPTGVGNTERIRSMV